jgi:hypothetical protein
MVELNDDTTPSFFLFMCQVRVVFFFGGYNIGAASEGFCLIRRLYGINWWQAKDEEESWAFL